MGMGSGGSGVVPTSMGSSGQGFGGRPATSSAAGPASGRYGGFGSEDIARLGFNQENKFNAPYDPYTKGQSAPSMQTHAAANSRTGAASARLPETSDKKKKSKKSKKNKKKKAQDSYDSESDDDDDDDSDDSDNDSDEDSDDKKKKSKRNKRKKRQLGKAP